MGSVCELRSEKTRQKFFFIKRGHAILYKSEVHMKQKIIYILTFLGLFILSQIPIGVMAYFVQVNSIQKQDFSLEQLGIVLITFLIAIATFIHWSRHVGLATWTREGFLGSGKIIAIGYGLFWVVSIWGSVVMTLQGKGNTANQAILDHIATQVPPLLLLLLAGIGAPIMEEILFRGLIIGKLFPKKQMIGLVISSFIFGLSHTPTDLGSWILYGGMGMVLGFVYTKTGKLEASVTLHILWNSIAMFASFFV
jgi:membrane protease YdiL (CAAX protease family)